MINLPLSYGQNLEQYIRSCSEQERMHIFRKLHYECNMCYDDKSNKQVKEVERIMKKMGYRWKN